MENIILDSGSIMKRMVKDSILGPMAITTKEDTGMDLGMDLGRCSMATERSMRDTGRRDSSMDRGNMFLLGG